jgi:TRAP-type C4-dicarboxylate transport system permease large subunit
MLESFVTIIILAPLLLPVAQQLDRPVAVRHLMTEAFGIGIILPPIGIALYVACAISGAQIEKASKPLLWYLPVLMAGLLLVTFVPAITTILPTLLKFKY